MLSHPEKELKKHLEEVTNIGMKLFHSKDNVYSIDKDIEESLKIILETHDYGKATEYFQRYIRDPEGYLKRESMGLKSHAFLSGIFTYILIMEKLRDKNLAMIGFYIVARHHGELVDFKNDIFYPSDDKQLRKQIEAFNFEYFSLDREEYLKKIDNFLEERGEFIDEIEDFLENMNLDNFLLINYLFSILISADKGAAIYAGNSLDISELEKIIEVKQNLDGDLVDRYKEEKFGKISPDNIDILREKIYKEVEKNILENSEKRIFSINVPTGSGKTLTAFNASLKLREKLGGKFRIVYNLPFTSIIDQNFKVFQDILGDMGERSDVLLKHHYLAQKNYRTSEESLTYDISEYLIENWESEVIVTTFVQFFNTLFSNENRKLKKYNALSNSIIILDEIQSLPHRYWKVINELLTKIAENYNSYIILVTATMPLIFSEKEGEIFELAQNKREYFKQFDRITLNKNKIQKPMMLEEFFSEINEDIEKYPNKSFLFIMNTIKSSLKLFENIKDKFAERKLYYLSTNIVPKERMRIIEEIKKFTSTGENPILISTQIVEAGVDIDFHRVYRDFSILDSINQSCGRCNRNGKGSERGEVYLYSLKDDTKEFSKYIYDSFLLDITKSILNDGEDKILEKDFFSISEKYFDKIKVSGSQKESKKLLELLKELKYKEANDSKDAFNLIPKSYATVDVFISIDEEGEELIRKYKELGEIENKFERKKIFDSFKGDFLSYVISIPKKFFPEGEEGFNFIDRDSLNIYYDMETGFKREAKQEDFFF